MRFSAINYGSYYEGYGVSPYWLRCNSWLNYEMAVLKVGYAVTPLLVYAVKIFLDYRVTRGFGSTGGLDLACPINRLPCHDGIQWVLGRITNSLPSVGTEEWVLGILGRPFLANIHAEINISIREVSLGIKEDSITGKAHRINLEWEGLSCTNWVRARYDNVNDITKERILQKIWDNKLGGQIREKTFIEEQDDPEKCEETKERARIGAMVNKLPEEWFLEVSRDKDDFEGTIDYLEPILYDGFVNTNNV
ncbi:hypothetical protein Tco_0969304 [Tanacetum coccineum]